MASVRTSAAALPGAVVVDPQREFAFSTPTSNSWRGWPTSTPASHWPKASAPLSMVVCRGGCARLAWTSFGQYREYLEGDDSEIERFINSISTNHTKFFREAHHFTHLRSSVAETFAQQDQKKVPRRLRVWSAGCSSGEEPYTIALVLSAR